MAARSKGVLARCAGALVALAGFAGCVDDGVSLHVICPIFAEIEDEACVFDPAGEACVGEGVLNLAIANSYKQSFRVESGLKPRERDVPPLGETNGIQVRSAKVDIRLPSGERIPSGHDAPNPFRVVASGYIPPDEVGAVSLNLITPNHALVLKEVAKTYSQIVLAVQIEGRTSGDQKITAGEYIWPVRLLQGFPNERCERRPYCSTMRGQDQFATACESTIE